MGELGARWASFVLLAALLVPAAASAQRPATPRLTPAQQDEARGLFEAGRAAFAEGRYASALESFERAHEIIGLPELLYNIGQSADRLRQDERALEAFRGYLDAVPDAEDRAAIEARIVTLERTIAEREADATAAAETRAQRAGEGEPPVPGATREAGAASPAGWILAGGAALVAITGAVLLGLAEGRAAEVRSAAPGTPWLDVQSAYGDAQSFSIAGGAMLGVGAAALAAGLVWALLDLTASGETQVALRPGRLELRGVF